MHLNSFLQIFGLPELKVFLKRWQLLLFLGLLVTASLLCIGFSEGTSRFLKQKMDNPFIKFVSVNVPFSMASDPSFALKLNKSALKTQYKYNRMEMVATRMVNFKGINGKEPAAFIRHINPADQLYSFLTKEPGVVISEDVVSLVQHPWSCIVTEGYLKKLGYTDLNIAYLNYILPIGNQDHLTPIPVAAIVTQLPDNHDMFVSDELFEAFEGVNATNPLDVAHVDHQGYVSAFIETENDASEIKKLLDPGFPGITVNKGTESIKPGVIIRINNLGDLTSNAIFEKVQKLLNDYKVTRIFDFGRPIVSPKSYSDKIVFYFSGLDSIRSFQSYLLDQHKLKIDMNTIEAKENFNLFDKISRIMALVLSTFSIILIVYVITSLVLEHIEKNKKNLGTLKAFGLSNINITLLYTFISLALILLIFMLSFFIASLTGNFMTQQVLTASGIKLPNNTDLFDLSPTFILVAGFLILPVLIVSIVLFSKLHKKTPGDLIYERA